MNLALILALARANWKLVGLGALVLVLGVQTQRLNHAKADLRHSREQVQTLAKRARDLSAQMLHERDQAVKDIEAQTAACRAERANALTAGRAIERASHVETAGGHRSLTGADQLRDIVGQAPGPKLPAKPAR